MPPGGNKVQKAIFSKIALRQSQGHKVIDLVVKRMSLEEDAR